MVKEIFEFVKSDALSSSTEYATLRDEIRECGLIVLRFQNAYLGAYVGDRKSLECIDEKIKEAISSMERINDIFEKFGKEKVFNLKDKSPNGIYIISKTFCEEVDGLFLDSK